MAANQQAITLGDRYQQMVSRIVQTSTALAAARWLRLQGGDLDGSYALWLSQILPIVETSQRQAAALSQAYVKQFVQLETGEVVDGSIDLSQFVGSVTEGKSLKDALTPPLFTIKRAIGDGDPVTAALAKGRHRAVRSVSDQVSFQARYAVDAVIKVTPKIIGYRRVCRPTACGACLAAATGAIQREAETLPCHPGCQCFKEPVIAGARDNYRRPTGEETFMGMSPAEQANLFRDSGGAETATLVRDGAVPFSALVQHQPTEATRASWITQAPREALIAHHSPEA